MFERRWFNFMIILEDVVGGAVELIVILSGVSNILSTLNGWTKY